MNSKLLPVLLFYLAFIPALADRYPKNPKVDVLHYSFRIELSDGADEIKCKEDIEVRFADSGVSALRFDLVNISDASGGKGMKVSQVIADGRTLSFTHENNELIFSLPTASIRQQKTTYTIIYSGVPATGLRIADNKYGDRTFFSDNWPDKGRNWLCLVDHPSDKATCEFIVTAPSHYQVVSNGLKVEESFISGDMKLTHWKQSVPIAPWLYVLGAARFAIQYVDTFDHKSIETWVYYQDRNNGFYDFAEPTKDVLEFYSAMIGPFVYEKLANIQSNSVSGGMEAASAILYSENSVVGDRNERWRTVVIHEIAHQWFGNAVTEYDWDDVWLSEGFATYFTLLFIEHQYGKEAFAKGLAGSRKTVLDFEARNPNYRIVHDNLSDMSKVTSSHTYQKGSWVLHMLRGMMGNDKFWKGIRAYYGKYMNGNASTTDFMQEMEQASGLDLKIFFDQWLYKGGIPKLEGTWKFNSNKKQIEILLNQVQSGVNLFHMPLQIGVYPTSGAAPVFKTVQIGEKQNTFIVPWDSPPAEVRLDPDVWVLMESNFVQLKK